MRVLMVADVVGGVRTYVRELSRELSGRGIEVDLALLGTAGADLEGLGAGWCEVWDLRLEWMPGSEGDVTVAAERVRDLCRRRHPDLVHVNCFTPILDPLVPVLLTVHSCVLTWWRALHGHDAPPEWASYRRLAAQALQRADHVVAPTRALLGELEKVYGELPQARAIPNGRRLRPASGYGTRREPLVAFVGRLWDEAKNAAALAAAAPAIRGRVAVIGDGESAPGIEHLGRLSEAEVLDWLRRAAVFAEPARYEPFGLAALEAALCGCALVLGDIPSLREVWGPAATYVRPDDPSALARAVNALLDDPLARERAAAAAQRRARMYTPAAMADAYVALYGEMARQPVVA